LSPKNLYNLIEFFDKHRVSFISITENFGTASPFGRLLHNIMLTFAQFDVYSQQKGQKKCNRDEKRFMEWWFSAIWL